ncbi:multiple inositol polyphosphate phosphatase 1-like isoform X1 [Neodiprion lecontei]|uniref:Multiple inositol polyphosphate phosphatase 1 n=1 Tax=Neodiprion lecontei TaxID=441921 RepID=A0ABM3GLT6_NEOLC|nr:multiple inositol polyphosphate phosphatase 1-like isoform X1 [Neodiprion pinetum]XP_046601195.1 multiple inositol polyphosphate phosphatase 1-like isoform X1 [Neodiprion lecontei]
MLQVKKSFLILIATMLSASHVLTLKAEYCYAHNDNPYLNMGTKTAYHFIHGGERPYETIPNCKPIQIWMMIRHGTRYPGTREIRGMRSLPKLRNQIIYNHEVRGINVIAGRLCADDLVNLKRWRLSKFITYENSDQLNRQGIEDMNLLGKRIRNNFPELFPPAVTEVKARNYKFRMARGGRMSSSLTAFRDGLLNGVYVPKDELPANSTLWVAYSRCPKWETDVANDPVHLREVTNFVNGPEYQNLITSVSKRLGFHRNISADTVRQMWQMCSYDQALRVTKLSPWCAVFNDEEMRVFEYRDALIDYYKRGNAHEYNVRLGCPPLRDMVDSFRKIEGNDDSYSMEPRGVFNVGRSRSYHLFMAALGIANDSSPLLASDFKLRKKYLWNTTEIGSFGANIAAVFYKCNDSASPNKVKFYQTEKPVDYPGCADGLCDWEYLKSKFRKQLSRCDDVDFCGTIVAEPLIETLPPSEKFVLVFCVLILLFLNAPRLARILRKIPPCCYYRCRSRPMVILNV